MLAKRSRLRYHRDRIVDLDANLLTGTFGAAENNGVALTTRYGERTRS